MKRKCPNSPSNCISSSSSSSSSCIVYSPPPLIISPEQQKNDNDDAKIIPMNIIKKKKPRVRTTTSPKPRSSIYRGVTRHRWTGRFEAHLWDKTTWNTTQNKRGRQIYLGAYDNEEDAARTYDLAALKYWGPASILNFPLERYTTEVEEMQKMSREEFLASLRRRSSGFSRGASKYRGVARHHHNGRWEARIGRVRGSKYLYLGTYSTQEEAAAAYDMAAIEYRGPNAVTNFDLSNYANKFNKVQSDQVGEIQVKQEINNPEPPSQPQEDDHDQHALNQLVQSNVPKLEYFVDKVHADEALHDHQESEPIQVEQPSNIPKFESIGSQDIVPVMNPTEDNEHPWDEICLDFGFNSLPIPDFPLDKSSELLALLDDKGFEEDIEFILDGHFGDKECLHDAISGTGECKTAADVLVSSAFKGDDVSTSTCSSSSPLSTTTSDCSNI